MNSTAPKLSHDSARQIRGAVLTTTQASSPYGKSRPLTITNLLLDPPRATEVMVRIDAAGLCHSDLSVVNGSRERPTPMLLGHEASATIVEIGDDVTGLQIGDRVVMTFLPRCETCSACATNGRVPCERGTAANALGEMLSGGQRLHLLDGRAVAHHLGVSAFATHAVVDARSVVRVDASIPPEIAALLGCAVLTGGGAVVNAGQPVKGEAITVIGLGGVGMAALMTAIALDLGPVYGIDPLPAKRELAIELGAASSFSPESEELDNAAAELVVEAAGSAAALESAVRLTAVGGRTVAVGLASPNARTTFSPLALVAGGRSIIGSYLGSAIPQRDIPFFVELWKAGKLPLERLLSGTLPLEDINAGLDALASGRTIRQTVLVG